MAEKVREALPEKSFLLLLTVPDAEDAMGEVSRLGYTGILTKPVFVSALKEKIIEIQAEQSESDPKSENDEGNLEGLNILAAEDNEINAEILTEILSMEGAKCEIAEDGKLVLERFMESEEGEFDVILMDVQMPVMNGYEATRAIRALERRDAREIPIIAMTANAFVEDEKEAISSGMNIHLTKPVDVVLLKKAISQFMKKDISEKAEESYEENSRERQKGFF